MLDMDLSIGCLSHAACDDQIAEHPEGLGRVDAPPVPFRYPANVRRYDPMRQRGPRWLFGVRVRQSRIAMGQGTSVAAWWLVPLRLAVLTVAMSGINPVMFVFCAVGTACRGPAVRLL